MNVAVIAVFVASDVADAVELLFTPSHRKKGRQGLQVCHYQWYGRGGVKQHVEDNQSGDLAKCLVGTFTAC